MKIVYHDPKEDRVKIIIPAPGIGMQRLLLDVPEGVMFTTIKNDEVPTDRSFRNAWSFNHMDKTFGHDMGKAKELHREKIRQARAPKLAELDTAYMRADEAQDPYTKSIIAAKKQKLRDFTKIVNIEQAVTVEELKTIWTADLGENPYGVPFSEPVPPPPPAPEPPPTPEPVPPPSPTEPPPAGPPA